MSDESIRMEERLRALLDQLDEPLNPEQRQRLLDRLKLRSGGPAYALPDGGGEPCFVFRPLRRACPTSIEPQ